MIGRHAVRESVRAAGIVGDVATDRAGGLAARVGRVEKAIFGDSFRYVLIDYARLDDGDAILQIDFQDAIQARQRQTMPPSAGTAPPASPVPEPRGTMGTLARFAALITADTCSTFAGSTTISGITWKIEPSCS